MCCMYTVYSGMQEWVIQIPSIPILVSVLFPSLHLKYFRIKFLLLVDNGSYYNYLRKHCFVYYAGAVSAGQLVKRTDMWLPVHNCTLFVDRSTVLGNTFWDLHNT